MKYDDLQEFIENGDVSNSTKINALVATVSSLTKLLGVKITPNVKGRTLTVEAYFDDDNFEGSGILFDIHNRIDKLEDKHPRDVVATFGKTKVKESYNEYLLNQINRNRKEILTTRKQPYETN